jgi:hypothetical protein
MLCGSIAAFFLDLKMEHYNKTVALCCLVLHATASMM